MFGWTRAPKRESIETVISNALNRIAREALNGVREKIEAIGTLADLQREKLELKEELETLRIEKDRKEEEQERKIREVEHKVGLEKARTEFEVEAAKREAVLDVREENLTEAQERFESQMEFHRDSLKDQIERAHTMVAQLLERMPSAEIIATLNKDVS
jgi:hypothetical protein